MRDLRMEELANKLITYSVDLKKNEKVLIEVIGTDGIPLAKALMKEAYKIGAMPFFNLIDQSLLKEMLKDLSEEQVKLYAKYDEALMKDMDSYI